MTTCFVIQPFDDRFDKRYEDVFRPAIEAAQLDPYRVDQDPASVVPIQDIEDGIRRSDACFAEISTDNPNVWFELGFAIAARKPVVMVCSEDRTRFPFDVQHRSIIRYKTESSSDFARLGAEITRRLTASLTAQRRIDSVEDLAPTSPTSGLTQHELVTLITTAAMSIDGDPLTAYNLKQELNRAGYTDVACALAIRSLEKKEYIQRSQGYDGNSEYWGFCATDAGLDWLDSNHDLLKLRSTRDVKSKGIEFGATDDDLPF